MVDIRGSKARRYSIPRMYVTALSLPRQKHTIAAMMLHCRGAPLRRLSECRYKEMPMSIGMI